MRPIDIIVCTFNNAEFLNPCVESIVRTGILADLATLHIVNNGKQDIKTLVGHLENIVVHEPGDNLGWEGGLDYALKRSTAPFVVFQNDDTFIPRASYSIYQKLLVKFASDEVAAVGPTTTVAAGLQSIYHPQTPMTPTQVSFLIFFTVMVRRKHLEEVGGIDTTLPGGDDFDMCMKFNQAGKVCLINPEAFLIHHGFKTGIRVRGDHNIQGGWNSIEMSERTNQALIRKHGFKNFIKAIQGLDYSRPQEESKDLEGDIVRSYLNGEVKILDLGCGPKKTLEKAIGVDWMAKGTQASNLYGQLSVADIQADVTKPLPFENNFADAIIARHILEHSVDSVDTLKNWNKVLKPGGRIVIAVPNEKVTKGIPLNSEHVHAFTEESLKSLMEVCGFKHIESKDSNNGVSFVGCYEKLN